MGEGVGRGWGVASAVGVLEFYRAGGCGCTARGSHLQSRVLASLRLAGTDARHHVKVVCCRRACAGPFPLPAPPAKLRAALQAP